MMTPEEIQRTMDFILASQANSVVRMDRVEHNFERIEQNFERIEHNLERLEGDLDRLAEDLERLAKEVAQQKETTDVLVGACQ